MLQGQEPKKKCFSLIITKNLKIMSRIDKAYHNLALGILEMGYEYTDKSRGQKCKQFSSMNMTFNLEEEFPILTTKKIHTKSIVTELLWFLRGDSNIKYLNENGNTIWNKDAYNWHKKLHPNTLMRQENFGEQVVSLSEGNPKPLLGDVGRNYGAQWRSWMKSTGSMYIGQIDQIANLIQGLKDNPMSRRHIVTAWNPAELQETALPPCHWAFEIIPRPAYDFEKAVYPDVEYYFILKWHQRSVDTFLGLPFNITSYAILAKIIEELTGYKAQGIIGDLSNVHIYEGHIDKVRTQLANDPNKYGAPTFKFSDKALKGFKLFREGQIVLDYAIKNLEPSDFIFENYESYPPIKADMYEPTN